MQVFSCVYFETPSDLNWFIFCCCCLIFFDAAVVVGAAILNSCKVFVNPTGSTKSCFHVVDSVCVYILLKLD